MTFAQRFALVLLAAFFLSTIVTSAAGYAFAGPLLRACARSGAAARAWSLAVYRLFPAAAAIAITVIVLGPGYFRHEQRGAPEDAGLALTLAAAGGLAILLSSIARAAHAAMTAARLRRSWLALGRPLDMPAAGIPVYAIETPFPLVAVLGVFRPRLFVSNTVLSACSPSEVAAIVDHERRHVSAFDNAMRLLMDAAPDALRLTRVPDALAASWHQAVEHRADDAARHRLDLASALVRVARLGSGAPPVRLPASALYRGEAIEDRVRRLLAPAAPPPPRSMARIAAGVAAIASALVVTAANSRVSEIAHDLLEAIVSLP